MKDNIGWGCFGIFVFAAIVAVVSAMANGWALATLWGWFVAPLFHLPELTIPYAIGLGIVVSFLTKEGTEDDEYKSKGATEKLILICMKATMKPVLTVAIGWIVFQFIS